TCVDRAGWQRAIKAATWPTATRTYKATALEVVAFMKPDGTLERSRPYLAAALGMPERSLSRHLTWLAEHGWMKNTREGGNGRLGRWEAFRGWTTKVPPGEVVSQVRLTTPRVVSHERLTTPGSCEPATRTQLAEVVSHPVARYKNQSSRSEVGAVDPDRDRRHGHDASRGDAPRAAQPPTQAEPGLAKVIPLRPRRHATTDATPADPPADSATRHAPQPTTQSEPTSRDAGGAGGRRLGPPKRHPTEPTDPLGLDQPPTQTSHPQRPLTSARAGAHEVPMPTTQPTAGGANARPPHPPRTGQTPHLRGLRGCSGHCALHGA